MVVQVCSTNANLLLVQRSSFADPLLFLRTKLEPNSMQIRTGSAILSSLLRVCNGPTAEVQQTYSRGTTIFLRALLLLCNFTSCELRFPLLTCNGRIIDL